MKLFGVMTWLQVPDDLPEGVRDAIARNLHEHAATEFGPAFADALDPPYEGPVLVGGVKTVQWWWPDQNERQVG